MLVINYRKLRQSPVKDVITLCNELFLNSKIDIRYEYCISFI